ncbi:MAG: 3-deoxy-D-manno-octulosonic acid transferase [Cypionkella sp.]
MAYSVGLTLYNLAARPVAQPAPDRPARPGGSLVWLQAASGESLGSMLELARRLIEDDGVSVLLTVPEALSEAVAPGTTEAVLQTTPADFSRAVQEFLDHWHPDLCVLSEGEVRPALIHEAELRKLPLLMTEARRPHLMPGREGWYPGLIKAALAPFRQIVTVDDAAARAFRKAGVEPARLVVAGRMEEASAALPHVESDRFGLAQTLATRPVWLAADIPEAEEAAIIAAHREVLKLAHRLLLILVPQDPGRAKALAQSIEDSEGWRVACRCHDQDPETETEVYIVEGGVEYGLWYRLAPVTFMGGSLEGRGCARNPMEAAAMGSAILYGPRSGPFGAAYGRLGAARAARMVGSASDLGLALGDLLSPDRAARQAQAAWTIASDGADVTLLVIDMIREILEGSG